MSMCVRVIVCICYILLLLLLLSDVGIPRLL